MAETDGNRLYGRGAWDDKPGIALVLVVLRALRGLDVRLCGDLEVRSVPDEEGGRNATPALCRGASCRRDTVVGGVRSAAVTGFMRQTWFGVCVSGLSSGGVGPDRGVNPVPLASRLIEALYDREDEMNDALKAGYGGQQRLVRFNVGHIQAGASSNSVPSCCVFDGQISFPPSKTLDQARRRVREAIADAAVRDCWLRSHPPAIRFVGVRASGCTIRRVQSCCTFWGQPIEMLGNRRWRCGRSLASSTRDTTWPTAFLPSVMGQMGGNATALTSTSTWRHSCRRLRRSPGLRCAGAVRIRDTSLPPVER